MTEEPSSLFSWAIGFAEKRFSNQKIGENTRWDLLFISILDSLTDEKPSDNLVDSNPSIDSVLWNYSAFLLKLKRHFPIKSVLKTEPYFLLVSPYARTEMLAFLKNQWEVKSVQLKNLGVTRTVFALKNENYKAKVEKTLPNKEGIGQYVFERGYCDIMKTRRLKENERRCGNFKR